MTSLLAQTSHGPGMHGPALVVLAVLVVVAGVVYLVKGRTSSDRDPASERDSDADV